MLMTRGISQTRQRLLLALVALALAVRVLVPAGWMPSYDAGHPTITLCTGTGMSEAWVDADGKIHKTSPDKSGKSTGFCAFSTLGLAFGALALGVFIAAVFNRAPIAPFARQQISVGRGLAAPPPPARGPPFLN